MLTCYPFNQCGTAVTWRSLFLRDNQLNVRRRVISRLLDLDPEQSSPAVRKPSISLRRHPRTHDGNFNGAFLVPSERRFQGELAAANAIGIVQTSMERDESSNVVTLILAIINYWTLIGLIKAEMYAYCLSHR